MQAYPGRDRQRGQCDSYQARDTPCPVRQRTDESRRLETRVSVTAEHNVRIECALANRFPERISRLSDYLQNVPTG